MSEPANPNTPETPSSGPSSSGPTQSPPGPGPERHWYIREIVVGVVVMVLGSVLVWALGIGTADPPRTFPPASVPDERATNRESIFTRENYARIQVGFTAWELEDMLGPPDVRQNLSLSAGVKQLYNLPETATEGGDAAATPTEYEEMVWESERFVERAQQHIAVLLRNGKVVARRQWALE